MYDYPSGLPCSGLVLSYLIYCLIVDLHEQWYAELLLNKWIINIQWRVHHKSHYSSLSVAL